jgi:hypothetical protein
MSSTQGQAEHAGGAGPGRQVIATRGDISRWIEPWYVAYAILGALASGLV